MGSRPLLVSLWNLSGKVVEEGGDRFGSATESYANRPLRAAEIGLRAGKVIGQYKMAKHFALTISAGHLRWARKEDSIQQEGLLDGI